MDYGKFYNSSYLRKDVPDGGKAKKPFRKGPSLNPTDVVLKSPDFHRPGEAPTTRERKIARIEVCPV